MVFSAAVTALSSLMICMNIAFSPLAVSTFAMHDYSYSDSASSPTHVLSTDRGITSSSVNRHTISVASNFISSTKDNTLIECNHNVFATATNYRKELGTFSSATTINTSATAPVRPPRSGTATTVAFKRTTVKAQIHRPHKRRREVPVIKASEAYIDDDDDRFSYGNNSEEPHSDEEERPKKKSRLVTPPSTTTATDQRFFKRRASTNTDSEEEEEDGDNSKNAEKMSRRVVPRQQRNCERNWETMFQLLLEYKQKHGDTAVPFTYAQNNTKIGKWISNQRAAHKTETLLNCRYKMLDSIGFAWKVQEEKRPWMNFYESLVDYKEEHNGSTAVPRKYPKDRRLGAWVNRQRSMFRKNQLSIVHIDLLESIGFAWDARVEWNEKTASHWMEMYRKLVSYKEEHSGSTVVPCIHNDGKDDLRQLGYWVKEQRRMLRKNELSKNRADLLQSIGFALDARQERDTTNWMTSYQKLVRYKHEHDGSTRVPQRYEKDPSLGRWVNEQRKRCKKKELVKLLDDIGFVWDARKK